LFRYTIKDGKFCFGLQLIKETPQMPAHKEKALAARGSKIGTFGANGLLPLYTVTFL